MYVWQNTKFKYNLKAARATDHQSSATHPPRWRHNASYCSKIFCSKMRHNAFYSIFLCFYITSLFAAECFLHFSKYSTAECCTADTCGLPLNALQCDSCCNVQISASKNCKARYLLAADRVFDHLRDSKYFSQQTIIVLHFAPNNS